MARKGDFAWKVTLSFESACLPEMPESIIESNDHGTSRSIIWVS